MERFTEQSPFELARNFRLNHQAEPEPFYAIAEPCEFCGRPISGETCPCETEAQMPVEPRCPDEYRIVMQAKTVAELCKTVKAHRLSCPVCNGTRKQPSQERTQRRKAA